MPHACEVQRVLVREHDRGRVLVELARREQPLQLRHVVDPEPAEEDEQVTPRDRVGRIELQVPDAAHYVEDPAAAGERAVEELAGDREPASLRPGEDARFYAGWQ